jgi:DNA-binding NtrC family response regulator
MFIKYPLKVVLIDDQKDILEIMEIFLDNVADFEIIKFTNPLLALEYIENNRVDITVLDIKMDEMSGDDLLRNICKLEKGIEVIIVTGEQNMTELMACYRCGARSYLSKPFTKKQFVQTINRSKARIDSWNSSYERIIESKS